LKDVKEEVLFCLSDARLCLKTIEYHVRTRGDHYGISNTGYYCVIGSRVPGHSSDRYFARIRYGNRWYMSA